MVERTKEYLKGNFIGDILMHISYLGIIATVFFTKMSESITMKIVIYAAIIVLMTIAIFQNKYNLKVIAQL